MKRTILVLSLTAFSTIIFSQNLFDALKMAENDISGTARYSSMAGAFGALGGDASAIKDNPAGLGIFRKSELTYTGDWLLQNAKSTWNGTPSKDNRNKLGANNFAFVIAAPSWRSKSGYSGLLSSNFSFSYNKLKNFNRNISVNSNAVNSSMTDYFAYFTGNLSNDDLEWDNYPRQGYSSAFDNENLPWMSVMAHFSRLISPYTNTSGKTEWESFLDGGEQVTPSYSLQEEGSIDEYSFGWSGNFSNRIFVGATLNFQSINYRAESQYYEDFAKGGGMALYNTLITNGGGFNLNVGAIVVPVDFIRIGIAFHTPTFYSMKSTNYSTLDVNFNPQDNGSVESPEFYNKYDLRTPLQLNLSAAFIGTKGIISAEYVFSNYRNMKLFDEYGNSENYGYDNGDINTMLNNARTIKLGGEYKVTNNFALRAGYANQSNIAQTDATKWLGATSARTDPEFFLHNRTDYLTLGLGYREAGWYVDLAYTNKLTDESYYAFNSTDMYDTFKTTPANVKTSTNHLVATIGLRF